MSYHENLERKRIRHERGQVKHRDKSVSVIIPCFNSPPSLEGSIKLISSELRSISEVQSFEIILVNDASPGDLSQRLDYLAKSDSSIKIIELSRNFGQNSATIAGLIAASSSLVLTMDDDNQHDPESLRSMIMALSDHVDVVYGIPEELPHGRFRNWSSSILKKIVYRSIGVKNAQTISSLRLFRRNLVEHYLASEGLPSTVIDVVLDWSTQRITFVEVKMRRQAAGSSRYTLVKLLNLAVNAVISFSTRPLRVATVLGIIASVVSLSVGCFYLFNALITETSVPGFTALAVLVTFLGSIQLLTLGILGEYVGMLHSRSMGKPTYVIRK